MSKPEESTTEQPTSQIVEQPITEKREVESDIKIEKIERIDTKDINRVNVVKFDKPFDQSVNETKRPTEVRKPEMPRPGENPDDFIKRMKDQGIEIEEIGEITKEQNTLKACKTKLQELIKETKGIEISDMNIDAIIDQVDKSVIEEIVAMKMRIEWERIFLKYYPQIKEKIEKCANLKIDLEKSRIVILEDKSSDYDIAFEDKEVHEIMKEYENRKIGRGVHARCILEMLIYNDIKKNLAEGVSADDAFGKFAKEKVGEVFIDFGENERVFEYREGVIYAYLAILEAHNLGIKDIEQGIDKDEKNRIKYDNEENLVKETYK